MPPTTARHPVLLWPSALLLAVLLAAPALGKGSAKPAAKFSEVVTAWQAGSFEGVARAMEAKGAVSFRLLAAPFSGKARSMRPEQARASLKAYFKQLSGLRLVDVTPKRSPASVRLYDYTYKQDGENARTTRLHVQLKQDGNRLWVLASVTESPKPRKPK